MLTSNIRQKYPYKKSIIKCLLVMTIFYMILFTTNIVIYAQYYEDTYKKMEDYTKHKDQERYDQWVKNHGTSNKPSVINKKENNYNIILIILVVILIIIFCFLLYKYSLLTIKKCPQCAENIKVEAVKCKHCGSDIKNA